MRTLIIIATGLVLLGIFLGIGKLVSRNGSGVHAALFRAFVVLWGTLAGINMWIGVAQAGYTFMEELPIFLLIFLGPVVPGYFIQRHLQRTGTNPPEHTPTP